MVFSRYSAVAFSAGEPEDLKPKAGSSPCSEMVLLTSDEKSVSRTSRNA